MSLLRSPVDIKVDGQQLANINDFSYNTEDKTLFIELYPSEDQYKKINRFLNSKNCIKVVSFVGWVDKNKVTVAPCFEAKIGSVEAKVVFRDLQVMVVQLVLKVQRAEFKSIIVEGK